MVQSTTITTLIFSTLVAFSAHAFTGDTPTSGDIYGEDIADNNFRADRAMSNVKKFIANHPASVIIESRSFETMSENQIADNASLTSQINGPRVTLPTAQYQDTDPVLMDAMTRAYSEAQRRNEKLEQFIGRLDISTAEFTELQKSFMNRRDLAQYFRTSGTKLFNPNAPDLYIEAMRKWNLGIVD